MAGPAVTLQSTLTLPDGRKQTSTYYRFAKEGDEIAMHEHPFFHGCFCLVGRVAIYDRAGKCVVLQAGDTIELPANREHAIRALMAGTQIVNANEPGF